MDGEATTEMRTLIRNGRIVTAVDDYKGDILIEGEVVSVGPGAPDNNGKLIPTSVKSGDYVLFGKWSGTEVKLDGEELLIMKESDIMGVLEGKKAKK